jgi:NADPH:quinone reductase-like Zn-dependent oxidoreductase
LVGRLGADDVIDYTREDVTDGTRRWNLIIDTGGTVRCPGCGMR